MTAPTDAELSRFLLAARARCYAADDDRRASASRSEDRIVRLPDGAYESACAEGALAYRDRWYGEARFAGEELVFLDGRPIFAMNYAGETLPDAPEEFPHFHKRALRAPPPEAPFRGPALHREGALTYVNDWTGDLTAFDGVERAFADGREIYRLTYHGRRLG
jgi:hypothetical protein